MRHVRFRMIRRYLAFRPEEIRAIDAMLDRVSVGSLGHGPIQLSIHSAAFLWSDGSKIQDPVSKIETAGRGVYCKNLECRMEL